MSNSDYKKAAIKKVLFSLVIVMIYILGSNLIFPGINTQLFLDTIRKYPGLSLAMGTTGLSLEHLSLFSIGLSPWMSTLILWRVISVTKLFKIDTLTRGQSYRIKFILSILLGIIQALAILAQIGVFKDSHNIPIWVLVGLLITGQSIIIWLSNINAQYGLGGPSLIIIVNMIKGLPSNVTKAIQFDFHGYLGCLKVVVFFIVMLLVLFVIFRFYQGERRLYLNHVMLDDKYATKSYLPISTNPSRGMPFMYSFTAVMFPQYVIILFEKMGSKFGTNIQFQMNNFWNEVVLSIAIILFTFGFSYVNVDYKTIAENLRNSGDYFVNVYPGINTEKYLFYKINILATVSAIVNVLIVSGPIFLSIFVRNVENTVSFIPTLIIVIILMYDVFIQFSLCYHRNDYAPFVDIKI